MRGDAGSQLLQSLQFRDGQPQWATAVVAVAAWAPLNGCLR